MTREEAVSQLKITSWAQRDQGNSYFADAIDMAIKALEKEPCEDAISRQAVLDLCDMRDRYKIPYEYDDGDAHIKGYDEGRIINVTKFKMLPSVTPQPQTEWIPVSERLPDNTDPVNITWVNHDPESYYAEIKNKPFTATGHYCNGRWWWYSVTCQDYLNEYGRSDVDAMDEAIEVTAWMPLPEPYKGAEE